MKQLKQPIHYANVKHRTCQTAKGQRRSPVIGPAYESNMPLLDRTTDKILYRKHTDGTEVIYNEIFSADPNCKYGDKSISIESRRTNLWNDLYAENKNNKERIAAYGEIAIPNNISNEEMIELAKRLGNYFTTTFKRPIDLSIHKKPGNNHIHFSLPEREYRNGKWMQKRKKFYKDIDGKLIYDKAYKDEKGWDIRKPKIDKNLVPKGANPYERDPETGNFLYQKIGERNKKQWEEDTRTGKFLEPDELSKMHNDIDDIVNKFLHEQGYNVTVKRNRPEVTKILKDHGIKQIRIATTDYKMNSPVIEEIQKKNERNKKLALALENNFEKEEKAEIELQFAKQEELKTDTFATYFTEERQAEEINLSTAKKEYQDAVKDYVENELHPEEVFIADYMQPYQQALTFKNEQCAAATAVLQTGIDKTNYKITELENQQNRSAHEQNQLDFLHANKKSFAAVSNTINKIKSQDKTDAMRQTFRQKWAGLTGWQRAQYIYKTVGNNAGIFYRDYMLANGEIKPENNPNLTMPEKFTSIKAIESVIGGKAVPGIKAGFNKNLSTLENAKNATAATLEKWTKNINQEIPLPPAASDFEFLTLAATAPERIRELNTDPQKLHFIPAKPKDYQPELNLQQYQNKEKEIDKKEEAERIRKANSPYTAERIRLNKIQIQNLERLLDKVITPEAEKIFKARQEERKKAIFSGKVTPAPDIKKIKEELRENYTDKNKKLTYSRVTKAAKKLGIDISAAEATRDALKANHANWHDENGNLLDVPKNAHVQATAVGQTKIPTTTQKEMPVEIQHPTVKRSKSKLDEIAFEKQPDGSYKQVDVDVNIRWNEKDNDHEKSEMEKAEEEMTKNWNPWKNR